MTAPSLTGALDFSPFASARVREHRMLGDGPRVVTADAVTLFVDVAGFTPLVERLAGAGSAGTEEITDVVAGFIAPATRLLAERGGDPVAFGGDALTVVFDDAPAKAGAAAVEVAQCLVELAEAASVSTSVGPVEVRVKVGVAAGPVTTAVAESTHRAAVVHVGAGLDRAVIAEGRAAPGQVVVDLHPGSVGDRGGWARARTDFVPSSRPRTPERFERLVHPALAARLTLGRSLGDSHRTITTMFVRMPPVTEGDLDRFLPKVTALLEAVTEADGDLVQVSGGDKGVVAMIVFGHPVAHEDDAVRAMAALLPLRTGPLRGAAVGVATGAAFIGLHGSDSRRFANHCGRCVNLAARLMQRAAPGQIVVDRETQTATAEVIRWAGPELVAVKGVDLPVEIHRFQQRRPRRRSDPSRGGDAPIIGREAELARCERFLDRVCGGQGAALAIQAEPGMGRSRLLREVVVRARARGMEIAAASADDHVLSRPGALWRSLLAGALGLSRRSNEMEWRDAITALLPESEDRLPLLGAFLGISFPPTALTSDLPAALGDDLVQELVVQLLGTVAARRSLLIAVDDVDRLDETSAALLDAVARRCLGLRIGVVGTRPLSSAHSSGALLTADQLPLKELAGEEVDLLVADTWARCGQGAPPPWLAEAVRSRAGGNPMFVEAATELLRALWEPGRPPPTDPVTPGRLAPLLCQRFDLLSPAARHLLGMLAVVQRPCDRSLLADLDEVLDPEARERSLTELVAAGLVEVELELSDEKVAFRHSATREVVYDQLSHAQRQRLHRQVATRLAARGADPVEIAEHVRHLADEDAARRWFPSAATAARHAWAISEAISWWQRALPVMRELDRRAAAIDLAELLLIGGRPADVVQVLDAHAPPAADAEDRSLAGRAALALGEATFVLGRLEQSHAALELAADHLREVDDVRRHQALEILARVHLERGDTAESLAIARGQLAEARASGSERAAIAAHASLGAALLGSGRPDEAAHHFEESRRSADTAGDIVHQIHVTSDLAGARYLVGHYADATSLLAEARALADRIGYRRHLATSLTNEAELRMCVGDPAAVACAYVATSQLLEMGDAGASASAMHTWLLADPGPHGAAAWQRLAMVEEALGRRGALAEALAHLAHCLLRDGDLEAAEETAGRAARLASVHTDDFTRRRATMAAAAVAGRSGDTRRALEILDDLAAEDLGPEEVAEISYHRWQVVGGERERQTAIVDFERAFDVMPSATNRARLSELGAAPATPPIRLDPPVGIAGMPPESSVLQMRLGHLEELARTTPDQDPGPR